MKMKKLICAILVLSAAVLLFAACRRDPLDKISDDDLVTYYVTDENGNLETDESGNPVIEYVTGGKKDETDGGLKVESADDEEGWGELIPFK